MAVQLDGATPTPATAVDFDIGKDVAAFRVFDSSFERVRKHYTKMRTHQTYDFVRCMEDKYLKFDKATMSVWEAFEQLDSFVDASDPDTDNANLFHMLQTAERMREEDLPDYMVLTGLLHDLGKIMFLWGDRETGQQGTADGDQWALGGDTWVVGCQLPSTMVFPELNSLNPDMSHPVYSTAHGVYEPGCGMRSLKYAWGHDEYLYRWAVHNNSRLPDDAMACIRLHSCYPWHTGGSYREFHAAGDDDILKNVQDFNKYDLYTKADRKPDVDELKPYYQALIDEFLPGELHW